VKNRFAGGCARCSVRPERGRHHEGVRADGMDKGAELLSRAPRGHWAVGSRGSAVPQGGPGERRAPGPVLTEVSYTAGSRLGSETEARFLDSVAAGELELDSVTLADLQRMADLVRI
jgi:hypothetical protein